MSDHGQSSSSDDCESEIEQSDAQHGEQQQQSLQDNSSSSDAEPPRMQLRKGQRTSSNVDAGTAGGSTGHKARMTGSSRQGQPAAAAPPAAAAEGEAAVEATTAAKAASSDGRRLPLVELPGGILHVDGMVGACQPTGVTVLHRMQNHCHAVLTSHSQRVLVKHWQFVHAKCQASATMGGIVEHNLPVSPLVRVHA
jgi:hypothetical protein